MRRDKDGAPASFSHPIHLRFDESLHKPLIQHGVGYLQEAADVGAVYQVAGRAVFLGRFVAIAVDGDHDFVQTVVYFLAGPAQARAVLGHFQSGSCHAASVRCFGWSVQDFGIEEHLGRVECAGHVRALGNQLDAVLDQVRRVFCGDLVLRGAGEGAIGSDVPERVVLQLDVRRHEDRFLVVIGILADASALHVLQFDDPGQLLAVDAVGIVDYAARVGHGHRLRAEIQQLLDGILRDVAAARYQADFAFERIFPALQHFTGEVHAAITSGFGTNQRTAPRQAFAGEDAGKFIPQTLVLSEQETDLAPAHANVAGRDVGVRSDVPRQFGHEALAEAHHFVVTLALGIEIRPALAAAHGQRSERILEDLFERQEFQNAKVHRGVEAQSALVWADGAIHLDAETTVDLDFSLTVKPGHAEHDDPLRLDNSFEQTSGLIFRMLPQH